MILSMLRHHAKAEQVEADRSGVLIPGAVNEAGEPVRIVIAEAPRLTIEEEVRARIEAWTAVPAGAGFDWDNARTGPPEILFGPGPIGTLAHGPGMRFAAASVFLTFSPIAGVVVGTAILVTGWQYRTATTRRSRDLATRASASRYARASAAAGTHLTPAPSSTAPS